MSAIILSNQPDDVKNPTKMKSDNLWNYYTGLKQQQIRPSPASSMFIFLMYGLWSYRSNWSDKDYVGQWTLFKEGVHQFSFDERNWNT